MNQEIITFLKAALECSVFLDPTDPGLSYEEILEVGKRAGWQPGEIGDALQHATTQFIGSKRMLPDRNTVAFWQFLSAEDPEYRNFDAFDFVVSELNAKAKADGATAARLERNLVVERAVANGLPRNDIEVAITCFVYDTATTEKDGFLRFPGNHGVRRLPSEHHAASCPPTFLNPGLDLCQIPKDASGRQKEASGEFCALLHFIDGDVGQRHDLAQLRTTHCTFEEQGRRRNESVDPTEAF